MKLMVKLQFSTDGAKPLDVVSKLQEAGFIPEVGDYDFSFTFDTPDDYGFLTNKLHSTLQGTKVRYELYTIDES